MGLKNSSKVRFLTGQLPILIQYWYEMKRLENRRQSSFITFCTESRDSCRCRKKCILFFPSRIFGIESCPAHSECQSIKQPLGGRYP